MLMIPILPIQFLQLIQIFKISKPWNGMLVFKEKLDQDVPVIDVRKASEYEAGHLKGAVLAPLAELNDHLADIPKDKTFYVHCAGGYRSVIAASILKGRGRHNLVDVGGGFKAIKEAEIPIVTD